MREYASLIESMAGKPFTFLGIVPEVDSARAKACIEKQGITWRCFQDDREDSIRQAWNVRSWPNTWVIDRHGIIRYRNVRGDELADGINLLLQQ